MNNIQYRIMTWQESRDGKWRFVVKKFVRVTFKSSKRIGWRGMGFVATAGEGRLFDTRAEALAFARTAQTQS